MKLKLKDTTEDWDKACASITPSMEKYIGKWITFCCIRNTNKKAFVGPSEDPWEWPLSMIEKVEGGRGRKL